MKDIDAFIEGRGRLGALLRELPRYEPPADAQARFVAALPADAAPAAMPSADGFFEPPASLADAVLAEAAAIDSAQQPRREAVLRELRQRGAAEALDGEVGSASEAWLQRQKPAAAPRPAPARKRRRWLAPLGGALAATVALGVALQVMRPPAEDPLAEVLSEAPPTAALAERKDEASVAFAGRAQSQPDAREDEAVASSDSDTHGPASVADSFAASPARSIAAAPASGVASLSDSARLQAAPPPAPPVAQRKERVVAKMADKRLNRAPTKPSAPIPPRAIAPAPAAPTESVRLGAREAAISALGASRQRAPAGPEPEVAEYARQADAEQGLQVSLDDDPARVSARMLAAEPQVRRWRVQTNTQDLARARALVAGIRGEFERRGIEVTFETSEFPLPRGTLRFAPLRPAG